MLGPGSFEGVFQRVARGNKACTPLQDQLLALLAKEDREWTVAEVARALDWDYYPTLATVERVKAKQRITTRYVRLSGKGGYKRLLIRAKVKT